MPSTSTNRRISQQVKSLLAAMTLAEKTAQLGSWWAYDLQSGGELDPVKISLRLKHGIGQVTRMAGAGSRTPQEAARNINRIQKFLKEETRLGIPAINHEECCSGLMAPGATCFPQIIGLASTFEPALAESMAAAIRRQMLAIGARQGLAPVLDIARDPRWGRVEETFGEDATLASQFGAAYIRGLQGEDLRRGVMATGKHFVGHSLSDGGLNCGPVRVGIHDLWETFLAPFQAAIQEGGLASMMNAYPELDGEVVAASKKILTNLLRDTLGFDGLVVSDYEAVSMIHTYHYAAETARAAAAKALTAGIDVELPALAYYSTPLLEALEAGEIEIGQIDAAVERHLVKKFELGLFDNPFVDEGLVAQAFDNREDRNLAYQIACKSLVLLKNNGILPLDEGISRLAVIGLNADSGRSLLGDYSYPAAAQLLAAQKPEGSIFAEMTPQDLDALSAHIPTILDGIRSSVSARTEVTYTPGCEISTSQPGWTSEACRLASQADAVVLILGGRSGLTPDCTTGEFRDAATLDLPEVQELLAEAVLETGKPVVLVLVNGRPASIPRLAQKADAILEAWLPGEAGGQAVAGALFGRVNPGGRLPISIPRSAGQLPVFYNHKPSGRYSNIYGGYVSEPVTPLYPFGHGLSYTSFEYTDLAISNPAPGAGDTVDISLRLTNNGPCDGDEVVQLYTRDLFAGLPRPVKELRGFKRVSLAAGESRRVTFHLPAAQLAYYNAELHLVVEAGRILVMVGSSSEDIRLNGEFSITGPKVTPIPRRIFACGVDVT